ncbi:ankyrin [Xylaria scruposa]|nr:ankyrin [Xylaria scruposa]
MDPFSTAASALQIASLAGVLLKSIYRFVEQTRTVVDSIHELYDEIRHLEAALHDIGETFRRRPRQLSFECRHHERIKGILESCRNSLEQLDHELPQLRDETTPIQKLKLSIQKSLKGDRPKEIIHHIISYTRILQLSLLTLSLGELWINRESQGMILAEVRKINSAIRATDLFSGRAETRARTQQLLATPSPTSPAERETRSILDEEKQDWRETVDEITAAVSLSAPDSDSTDGRLAISMHANPSRTTLKTPGDDGSSSEQEELDDVSRKVIQLTLEHNQNIVRQLMQSEIYFQAAEYQRRGIKKRKRLNEKLARQGEEYDNAGDISKLKDMREMLADILCHCDTTETDDEAEKVLEELLGQSERLGTDDTDRKWRLYHKLGTLYARQGNFCKSEKFLRNAFMGRSRANPRRKSLVIESAEILIKTLQVLQLIDEARGIQGWLEEEWSTEPSSNLSSPQLSPRASFNGNGDLSGAYRWSVDQGFDVNNPHFGFDVCDPGTGNAPIHLAIQHQNFEALQSMLLSNPHVEQLDSMGAAPIHLAATTRNKRICALLLEKGADVNVVDQKKRSPLHRCQSSSGGVQGVEVAKLILDRSPNLIDHIDYIGKTALCMACEQGNENMATFLLERGADPNRGVPGQFIPLISAIDAVAQSRPRATIRLVKLLLEKGADARLRDGSGRTAFDAANNAGLKAGEIKKLLNDISGRRPSTASTTDTAKTSSTTSAPRSSETSLSTSIGSHRSISWRGRRAPSQPPE